MYIKVSVKNTLSESGWYFFKAATIEENTHKVFMKAAIIIQILAPIFLSRKVEINKLKVPFVKYSTAVV